MKTPIEFAVTAEASAHEETTPWSRNQTGSYEELIFKPEYLDRRLRFPLGTTWFRILPPLKSSIHSWMLPIHAINYDGGRFAHPRTCRPNAKSAFDVAYAWYSENRPDLLYSKANRTGVRFLSDPMSAFWVALEKDGKTEVRLFLASAYDGSRGGTPGLGYQIWKLSRERDEMGNVMQEIIDPEKGVLVCVEKTKAEGARFPRYDIRVGRSRAPLSELLQKMDESELSAICPLENTVRILSAEEEWRRLEKLISPENVNVIRKSVER